jgi:hypothetical protein
MCNFSSRASRRHCAGARLSAIKRCLSRRKGSAKNAAGRAFLCFALGMSLGAGSLGCNEDGNSVTPTEGGTADGATVEVGVPVEAAAEAGTLFADAGHAVADFSSMAIDFGPAGCGASAASAVWNVSNSGTAPLTLTAATTGSAFSVNPSSLSLARETSGALTLTASVPGTATAGQTMSGSLDVFTDDPGHASATIPLSVQPIGATLAWQSGGPSIQFASIELGRPSAPVPFTVVNVGNAPATFSFGPPSDPHFTMSQPVGGAILLGAGSTWVGTASFTPADTRPASATAAVTATGATCGGTLQALAFSGQGSLGQVTGYPATVDLGPGDCGGAAPSASLFVLTNGGSVDAHITMAHLVGSPGFTTTAAVGRAILAGGGILAISVAAPAVASPSPLTPITATLMLQTDADASAHAITLTAEPRGAILGFDTSPTPGFGSFGPVVLLQSALQSFNVANTGNAPASVALATMTPPFALSSATFSIAASGIQADAVTFSPTVAAGAIGAVSMSATGALCQPLPAPIALSGSGIGGGPSVAPTSLVFPAVCGGAAPATQTFMVSNSGSADFTWSMGPVTGTGAAQYAVTAIPPPGRLIPGASATVTVTAVAVPSPADDPSPAALAAQLSIATDVPYDGPHVVSLGETPLGDQLGLSPGGLRFGEIPIDTTAGQALGVTNGANAGSPAAAVSFSVRGAGAAAYTVAPGIASVAPGSGASQSETLVFAPTTATDYPATLTVITNDSLCTALPPAVALSGTGTQGEVALSASILAFGTDPSDAQGLVDCGGTGRARTLTVSNVGNQTFHVTGLSLGGGAKSPYALSGAGSLLPATVPIGGAVDILLTPEAIPNLVANPTDATLFADTLTVSTDAALDTAHPVLLTMQARGAVIASTPLTTVWTFGTLGFGSTGTFTSTLRNTGNAAVSVALEGLAQPSVFGMQNNPTLVPGNTTTPIVGQFTPPASDGSWSDQGMLQVTALEALCAPLPAAWTAPLISLSGSSNSSPAVTVSGAIAFGTSDCGGAAPSGQALLLTNQTNRALAYTLSFNSGFYYSAIDTGKGTLPANGIATIVVTPTGKTFGPAVLPGSAPYADDLVVTLATSPPTMLTLPLSWTLNGAVLSLPQGAGPDTDASGHPFYAADSTSGFPLPMENTGTASVTVAFAIQPAAGLLFSPAPPVQVTPGIGTAPELFSTSFDATCPTLTPGTLTFVYSGPVCQPFPLPQVNVEACVGTF